ncbi:hypothetical protein [Brevundimonas sp.]|uniref:hypothetical protein n=1 Tax=Brevundimonas sp. TaxID=1871086 RepID=UPI003B00EA5A
MGGKQFTRLQRSISWKEGRYGKRRRARGVKVAPKPPTLLEYGLGLISSIVAVAFVLAMAFILLGSFQVPMYISYGALLAFVGAGGLILGPRDRLGIIVAVGLTLFWIVGVIGLFLIRDEIQLHRHEHRNAVSRIIVQSRAR